MNGPAGVPFPNDAEAYGAFDGPFSGGGSFPPASPGVMGASSSGGGGGAYLRSSQLGASGNFFPAPVGGDLEDYANEPPLLEELGVSFAHIYQKVVAVLMLHKPISPEALQDADLAGPLVFCVLLGFCMLLVRRCRPHAQSPPTFETRPHPAPHHAPVIDLAPPPPHTHTHSSSPPPSASPASSTLATSTGLG